MCVCVCVLFKTLLILHDCYILPFDFYHVGILGAPSRLQTQNNSAKQLLDWKLLGSMTPRNLVAKMVD